MAVVLLADDDVVLRDMYRMRLTKDGFTVYEAVNGQDVVEQAGKLHPDIILLDVMMPKMNGLDALKVLRSGEETKNIPIIILTALSQDVSQFGANDVHADGYISKSEVVPDQVMEKVKTVLAEHPSKVKSRAL